MEMSAEERIFEKLDSMGIDLAQVKTDVAVLKNREQPAHPCRCYMDSVRHEIEENQKAIKYDMNNIAYVNEGRYKDIKKEIEKKATHAFFWKFIVASFGFTSASFVFTWVIYLIVK